jgi:hypothetical protein
LLCLLFLFWCLPTDFLPKETLIEIDEDFVPFVIIINLYINIFIFINMEDKLSKYVDDTSNELLSHFKRTMRTYDVDVYWMKEPIKFIVVDDKSYRLENNKKYLVNKIYQFVEDDWSHLSEKIIRRTIKKYLDGIS